MTIGARQHAKAPGIRGLEDFGSGRIDAIAAEDVVQGIFAPLMAVYMSDKAST